MTTCAHGVFIAYNIIQAQLDNEKLGEDLIEIIYYDKPEIDVSALNEERERLLRRIAEIEELYDRQVYPEFADEYDKQFQKKKNLGRTGKGIGRGQTLI